MSQPCTILECKRYSRALCHCCQKNLCLQHLNEHNDFLVSQLSPLTDGINVLSDRLNALNSQDIMNDCRGKLDKWRVDCHQKIDQYFEEKCQECDRLITDKLDSQRKSAINTQVKLTELAHEQEATQHDIDSLTSLIRQLTTDLNSIEKACFQIRTRPLTIDDSLIELNRFTEQVLDLSKFPPIHKTIQRLPNKCKIITTNHRYVMIQPTSSLCLIDREMTIAKQSLHFEDTIFDMCWSSILACFIIIAKNNIYTIDENTMNIRTLQLGEKRRWFSCTCSDDFLFLSTYDIQPSVVKFLMHPSVKCIDEWNVPNIWEKRDRIDDLVYSNEKKLALIISNVLEKTVRFELRSSDTFEHIWMLSLNVVCDESISIRCCTINYNEWLVADFKARCLIHITNDGRIKMKIPYHTTPYRVALFSSNFLVVADEYGTNFHKIL
ncbi:hypothetical protein I4U23_013515 [Adineta vaga]|nr:hypothetical protein I4U23_013515 [Adineta vaga]